jgi:hypothetical protein
MQSPNRYMGVLQEACNLNFKIKTFHLPHKEKKSITPLPSFLGLPNNINGNTSIRFHNANITNISHVHYPLNNQVEVAILGCINGIICLIRDFNFLNCIFQTWVLGYSTLPMIRKWWKKWVDFEEIKFHLNENIE